MATSQTPNPHRRRIGDQAPDAPPDGDPTTPPASPTETTAPRPNDSPTVIVPPDDFRLPAVLKHIEAGKIVLVMPPHNDGD
jgi:hypothetical protein